MEHARKGKIARLPYVLREEVCRRLLNGEIARKFLPWLNEHPDTIRVCGEHFDGEPVSESNISEWRGGGYKDWLGRREQVERTQAMANFAVKLAEGGNDLLAGGAAIVGGQLLEMLETLDLEQQKALLKKKPGSFLELVGQLAKLQKSQAESVRSQTGQRAAQIAEKRLELDQARFERTTCELFLKWWDNKKAAEIADGKGKPAVKIAQLRQLMFQGSDEPAKGGAAA